MAYIRIFVQGALAVTLLQCVNTDDATSLNDGLLFKRSVLADARKFESVSGRSDSGELFRKLTQLSDEAYLIRKRRSEDSSANNQTQLKTYKVNSILFGDHCYWLRLVFFIVPFYFCPTTTVVEYNVSNVINTDTNDTGINLSNKFGEDLDENQLYSSPIDLVPAKPKRPLSRVQPPAHHGKLNHEGSSNIAQNLPAETTLTAHESYSPTQKPVSKCTTAILNCCLNGSTKINNACFERMSCPGPFWDFNPCDPENVQSARNAASMTSFP